jgi:hypothetical protein
LTNFSNGKQTQESLESGFPETTFRKTNTALFSITLPNIEKYFPGIHFLKGNYFPANKRDLSNIAHATLQLIQTIYLNLIIWNAGLVG